MQVMGKERRQEMKTMKWKKAGERKEDTDERSRGSKKTELKKRSRKGEGVEKNIN